ncbi:MAG: acetolactate decarboxylase [Peptococcaceae bacterium]|nr:acetolactate decarboxylase [Peptococcaceae bacterium]
MKNRLCRVFAAILLAAVLALAGCARAGLPDKPEEASRPGDTVFQVSTINALLQGIYDGEITCGELKKQGDLGVGTFDGLDGEMVMVDGEILQVKADGKVLPAADGEKVPFAAVTFFRADLTQEVREVAGCDQLQRMLDGLVANRNLFCAIRVDGTFSHVKTRSVARQAKPYPPLAEAVKNQSEFEMRDVRGTVVGFYCPPYVQALNVPGYHLHFVTGDRRQGGHLLDCSLREGTVQVDSVRGFHMMLPAGVDFARADLTAGRKEELKKVESE